MHIFAASVREALEEEPLRAASRKPLSLTQFQLLRLVARNGLDQAGVAARFLGVTPPALTRNIDKLVRLRLLTRGPSRADRRALILKATARGRALVRRHDQIESSRLGGALRAIKRGESAELARLLQAVAIGLLQRANFRKGDCLRCAGFVADDCPVAHLRGGCPYQAGMTARRRRNGSASVAARSGDAARGSAV